MVVDPSARLDIVIVGAGLSGAAASIACALAGHSVTCLDSASEFSDIGAGIQVTPNATRLLKRWGVLDILSDSVRPQSCTIHRYANGKVLAHEDNYCANLEKKYDAPFLDMYRADLHLAMISKATELGVQIKLNSRVETVDFETTTVETSSGDRYCGDLIVGADGLWSRCRENFLGKKDEPRATGDIAFRSLIKRDEVSDPKLLEWIQTPRLHFWIGPGAHVVAYPIGGGKMYNLNLVVPDNLAPGISKQKGTVEEMLEHLKDWDPLLSQLVSVAKSERVSKWKLMHRDELESWTNERGNFVLIGDSCHPMLPYLAQGANSSLEDGAVLGGILSHLTRKDDLVQALSLFQKLRKQRGESIVREAFKQRDDFHMHDGAEQAARDERFLSCLGKEIVGSFPSRWTCPEIQPWLYGYDAYSEVEKAIDAEPFDKS